MHKTILIFVLFKVCACGPDVAYTVYGVDVWGSPLPQKDHLQGTLYRFFELLAEETNDDVFRLRRHFRRLSHIEFFPDVLEYKNTGAYGLYWYYGDAAWVEVYLVDSDCVGYSALAHELMHHYQKYWGLGGGHSEEWIWAPGGLLDTIVSDLFDKCSEHTKRRIRERNAR